MKHCQYYYFGLNSKPSEQSVAIVLISTVLGCSDCSPQGVTCKSKIKALKDSLSRLEILRQDIEAELKRIRKSAKHHEKP